MNTRRFLMLVMSLGLLSVSGSLAVAQEEFTDLCTTFWNDWATGDFDAAVARSSTPFLFCDGKSISVSNDNEELSKQLNSIRSSSDVAAEIFVNIKKELSFKDLPMDSFRLSDDDRSKVKKFFQDDDVVIYVELRNKDGEKRDMFVLVVRWCDGDPKGVGIFD